MNHELKKEWCWWKKTQAPVNREKVLGELADVAHFCLNIFYHEYYMIDENIENNANFKAKTFDTIYFYKKLIDAYYDHRILENLLALTFKLGFTLEELYEAYKTKNEINYQRIASGY